MSPAPDLVSVIIPVCNGQTHLPAALDSVQAQTHRNVEILAVDDGSTDDSGRILSNRAAADHRMRVFTQENRGVSAARNRALAAARGEWIVFVDADDMLADPRTLEVLVLVGGRGIDIVDFATSSELRDVSPLTETVREATAISTLRIAALAREVRLDHRRLAEMIAEESANAIWGRAYRRSLLDRTDCRFVDGLRMGEDLLFNLDCFGASGSTLNVPITGYFYRRTSTGSATERYLPGKFRDLTVVGDHLIEWARATGSDEVTAAADFIRAKNVLSCMRDLHHTDCDIPRRCRTETARTYRAQVPKVYARVLRRDRRILAGLYNLLGYRAMFRLSGLIGSLR